MRETLLPRTLALFLVGLLSLAFALGTLNARVPDTADLQMEAFLFAGFSSHDLCATDDDSAHKHDPSCALCLSFAQPAIPTASMAEREARYSALVIQPRIRRAALHRHDPATPLRGPPSGIITPA